jgi:hypothetical protein
VTAIKAIILEEWESFTITMYPFDGGGIGLLMGYHLISSSSLGERWEGWKTGKGFSARVLCTHDMGAALAPPPPSTRWALFLLIFFFFSLLTRNQPT